MKLEKLKQLYNDCRVLPNYQYANLPAEEFLNKALKSFSKVSDKQKKQILESWGKVLGKSIKDLTVEEIHELANLRFLAQSNLYFLCHLLESYNEVTVSTHEEICNDFFVQKDPTFTVFKDFANQYTELKDRMLLVPRGGFKSSIDMADCIQWVLCFPAITILILTGVYDLAGDFVGEIKRHFTLEETGGFGAKNKALYGPRKIMDKQTGEWSESMFQILFPEHCITPTDGTMFEYQTPAESDKKEPTVRAASIEQALSGSHFDILKLDDVVTNENSQTPDRMLKINKQIEINKAMMNPYGFFDVIGTWYDENDFYGITIHQEETFAKEQGIVEGIYGSVDSGRFNSSVYCRIYLRAAWWPTEAALKAGKIEDEMTKEDWELWFPDRLTYEFLSKEKKTDKTGTTFAIKYLNDPRKMHKVKFPRELLIRRTLPHHQLPPSGNGIIVTAVDTAYSTKNWADYTVILTGLIFGGRFYIVNMVRGRFNEDDLPKVIAQTAYKWKPKRISIEDSVGVKWFGKELRREMDRLQISIPVEYVSLGYGSKLRSKQLKAKPVLRLLGDERLYFLNSCEGLEDIYNEMSQFTGTSDDKHDDIVSAISLLVEQYSGYADVDSRINSVNQDYVLNQKSIEVYNRTYCLGKYAQYNEVGPIDENPVTNYQIDKAQTQSVVQDSYIDPLQDLFR
jgi:phage terminase large subunit-like protein